MKRTCSIMAWTKLTVTRLIQKMKENSFHMGGTQCLLYFCSETEPKQFHNSFFDWNSIKALHLYWYCRVPVQKGIIWLKTNIVYRSSTECEHLKPFHHHHSKCLSLTLNRFSMSKLCWLLLLLLCLWGFVFFIVFGVSPNTVKFYSLYLRHSMKYITFSILL